MLAEPFETGHALQERGLVEYGRGREQHIGHHRTSLGDGAGLVQHHRAHIPCPLEDVTALDENPHLGTLAAGDHDCGGDRQPHGTRAGDDEHGHGGGKGPHQRCLGGGDVPDTEGEQRQCHDHRHEHGADAVGQVLNGGAAPLSVTHEPHDLREHAVGAKGRGAIAEGARAIDGTTNDPVARLLRHRQRLAGEHAFVHGALALHQLPVSRHALPRAHDDDLVGLHRIDGRVHLLAKAHDTRRGGLQIHESAQGHRRAHLRARLEGVAGEDEGNDDDDRFVVHVGHHPAGGKERRRERGQQRVAERREGAGTHQRVHVGAAMTQRRPGPGVEVPTGPHHDQQRRPQQPHGEQTRRLGVQRREDRAHERIKRGHGPAHERVGHHPVGMDAVPAGRGCAHERHTHDHGHHANEAAHPGFRAQIVVLGTLRAIPCFLLLKRRFAAVRETCPVAGITDDREQRVG